MEASGETCMVMALLAVRVVLLPVPVSTLLLTLRPNRYVPDTHIHIHIHADTHYMLPYGAAASATRHALRSPGPASGVHVWVLADLACVAVR